jgi:hypothetical protein
MPNTGTTIVVVSGLPRSGTSMMMRMLDTGGIEPLKDDVRKSDEDNPRGYFEVELVKTLKKQQDKSWIGAAQNKAIKVVSSLLKDLPNNYKYDVIFMNRSLEEVIASQNKMIARRGEVSGTDDLQLRQLYEQHLRSIKAWLRSQANFRLLEVSYNDVIEHPGIQAERVNTFLGSCLDVANMSGAVDEQLYRNRARGQTATI